MLQHVNAVLIGKRDNGTNGGALLPGDIAILDQNKNEVVMSQAGVDAAEAVYVAVFNGNEVEPVTGQSFKKWSTSSAIKKCDNAKLTVTEFRAPEAQEFNILANGYTPIVDARYCLKVLYKDLSEYRTPFTHTYEVFATTTAVADLMNAFVAKINKHAGARVTATLQGANDIKLVAKAIPYQADGVEIDEYSIVSMAVSFNYTIAGPFATAKSVPMVTIVETVAPFAGNGYYAQVKDSESRAAGYKGHVMDGAYPTTKAASNVVANTPYDSIVVESDASFLSSDNQYVKTTPLTAELYAPALVNNAAHKFLDSFINGTAF